MSWRGAVPPLVLILAATAGTLGCDTEARRQRRAEEARQRQAWEDARRREAETAPPTQEVLDQVRAATQAFMTDKHPDLAVEGTTFTPLTPNLFLVGVDVKDLLKGNRWTAQLSAERLRDGDWDADFKSEGKLVWVVDYADAERMRDLATLHGFGREVEAIQNLDRDRGYQASWGRRTWLDDYLLWHFLFHRPTGYGYRPGAGWAPMPAGYRFHDPGRPITPEDASRFQAAAAPTGGRSMVFLGGSAWRPPLVPATPVRGSAFGAGSHGTLTGPVSLGRGRSSGGGFHFGGVSRGGFGGAGHASGTGG